jgi:hypothetical protein
MANFYLTPTGAGALDGSDWDNAFSMAEFTTWINTLVNAGDICYIYSGTYTVSTIINTTRVGSFSAMIRLLGVQDQGTLAEATGDNRPLFNCTSTTYVYLASYTYVRGLRVYKPSQRIYALKSGAYNTLINVRSEAVAYCPFYAQAYCKVIDCEAICTGAGLAGMVLGAFAEAIHCVAEAQDTRAYYIDAGNVTLIGCISRSSSSGVGFYVRVSGDHLFYGCTLDGHNIGFDVEQAKERLLIINTTISNCTTGINVKSGASDLIRIIHNNFYNNTTDVVNATLDSDHTALDPDFVDKANYDYRLKTTSGLRNIGKNLRLWIGS